MVVKNVRCYAVSFGQVASAALIFYVGGMHALAQEPSPAKPIANVVDQSIASPETRQKVELKRRLETRGLLEQNRLLKTQLTGQRLFEREWEPETVSEAVIEKQKKRAGRAQLGVFERFPFKEDFVESDGLGPLYNAKSCVACHVAGGASGVEHNVTLLTIDPQSVVEAVNRQLSTKALPKLAQDIDSVFPGFIDSRGRLLMSTLVHDYSTRDGYESIRQGLANFVAGGIDDAWFAPEKRQIAAIAAQPVVSGRHESFDFYLSQRNSPPLFGMGEIEKIETRRLQLIAQSQPKRSGGVVSGRLAGKFGWRGQVETLASFVSGACAGEMGLNQTLARQSIDPADRSYSNFSVDVSQMEVMALQSYVSSLPRPIETKADFDESHRTLRGERLFATVGCEICHTGEIRPVSGIFSDLLLHDMGPALQSPMPAPGTFVSNNRLNAPIFEEYRTTETSGAGYYDSNLEIQSFPLPYPMARPDQPTFPKPISEDLFSNTNVPFESTWNGLQREWRTPPLWGVADSGPYLHDGRAATLEEAILMHGGEAELARNNYEKLSAKEKELILEFLGSLRAPVPLVQ